MSLERIAEFEVLAEYVKTLVAAEPLQLGRMDAAVHAGGQGAALEAVAAEIAQPEAGRDGAGLDDLCDGLRRDRRCRFPLFMRLERGSRFYRRKVPRIMRLIAPGAGG